MIPTMSSPSGPEDPQALFDRLRRVARVRGTVFYSDLALSVGIDTGNPHFGSRIGRILDDVNRIEFDQVRPLLSAVVILKDSNMPGSGFFACARELKGYNGKDDLGFWVEELRRVHDYWSRH